MNKNWNENLTGIDTLSKADAMQYRMMGASCQDKSADRIVAKAQDDGMFDPENRELYDLWFNKMMY
ncbi:MAG TPA: hypothetical protein H9875_04000 [Candidatus Levilactobacillus faecigallinarum]|uniref:Uncharacterized protein n=1 Tax=Candidatus Levilactobacillus faecigallinarum TaxID=2838638 RepID=A0A9D1U4K5_9LACO|nr:hypothetical protein [Candidatus Levilactobacillus faecigallinarum]